VLLVLTGLLLLVAVLAVGNLYLRLHSLPERLAHKSEKLQFEIVAILGLLALFTHIHLFWIAALLLAVIDIPDFGTPLRNIAGSVERIADAATPADDLKGEDETAEAPPPIGVESIEADKRKSEVV
jgi:hypothetical protein